jgi:hypothetical protein
MNEGSSGSGSSSATTHASVAPSKPHNGAQNPPSQQNKSQQNNKPQPSLSETQYLQRQAQQAKDAIGRTLSLITSNLGHSADPRAWTREHPWLTLGAAAIGGFTAVTLVVPTKEQRVLRRLAAIERAVAPKPPQVVIAKDGDDQTEEHPAKHGVLHGLFNEVLKAVRPAVMSAITAGITAKAATKPPEPEPPPPPQPPVEGTSTELPPDVGAPPTASSV